MHAAVPGRDSLFARWWIWVADVRVRKRPRSTETLGFSVLSGEVLDTTVLLGGPDGTVCELLADRSRSDNERDVPREPYGRRGDLRESQGMRVFADCASFFIVSPGGIHGRYRDWHWDQLRGTVTETGCPIDPGS